MTILEALATASKLLKASQINLDYSSPMLDAEVLLCSVLSLTKPQLFSHANKELQTHEQALFFALIDRRVHHEPIAYLVGSKPFYGRTFTVNRHVLIPRPATECLVETALRTLATQKKDSTLVTDIGTGSGAIALTIAAESGFPVIACDISEEALTVTRTNAQLLNIVDLIDTRKGHLLEPLIEVCKRLKQTKGVPHYTHLLIIANLPYLTLETWKAASPELRLYEPVSAFLGGIDGLDLYRQLFHMIRQERDLLPIHITCIIEIDPHQTKKTEELIRLLLPYATVELIVDLDASVRGYKVTC